MDRKTSTPTTEFSNEMNKLFKSFNYDLDEIMRNKRMYFEKFVQDSMKKTSEKLGESDILQGKKRKKHVERFEKEFYEIMKQAASELERLKTIEDKIQCLLNTKKNKRDVEKKIYLDRFQELKKLNEEFCQEMKILDKTHSDQYSAIIEKVREEMFYLQKKTLMETQKKEMGSVRKRLKQTIF